MSKKSSVAEPAWLDVGEVIDKYAEKGINFFYFCGGRGIGKTYSCLDYCYKLGTHQRTIDWTLENEKFIYLRRSKVQAETCGLISSSPFKVYNRNNNLAITPTFNSQLGYGDFFLDREKTTHIGYLCALSTFQNLRGIDFSDVTFILYDECIAEDGSKAQFKNEGRTLLNLYETVNRNRIIEGRPECILVLLSNPIDLSNDLLAQLDFTKILSNMIVKGQQRYTDYDRSLHIEKLVNHGISRDKAKGALYKFAPQDFADQSLTGDFTDNDFSLVDKSIRLDEYYPLINCEICCVYRHKSLERYHISSILQKAKFNFTALQREAVRDMFYFKYKLLVLNRIVTYETYQVKYVFENFIRYKQPL